MRQRLAFCGPLGYTAAALFPIRDSEPSFRPPVAVYALIVLNVAVFLLQLSLPIEVVDQWVMDFGVLPSAWSLGLPPVWQLLTSQFLHGGLLHLLGNMWMLWIFGDNVEDRTGSLRFIAFYLCCGILAAVAHLVTNLGSAVPAIGASGAIAGVMGAYLGLFPRARVILFVPILIIPYFFEVPAVVFLALWFVIQSFSGLADSFNALPGAEVAYWAHVGGFLGGILIVRMFLKPRGQRRRFYPDEWGPEAAWRRQR